MRQAFLTFGLVVASIFALNIASAQEVSTADGAEITFEKEKHDYGTIEQNADGTCEFKFYFRCRSKL